MSTNIPKARVGRFVTSFPAPPGFSAALISENADFQITKDDFIPCIGFVVREFENHDDNGPCVLSRIYPVTAEEDCSYLSDGDDFLLRSPPGDGLLLVNILGEHFASVSEYYKQYPVQTDKYKNKGDAK